MVVKSMPVGGLRERVLAKPWRVPTFWDQIEKEEATKKSENVIWNKPEESQKKKKTEVGGWLSGWVVTAQKLNKVTLAVI